MPPRRRTFTGVPRVARPRATPLPRAPRAPRPQRMPAPARTVRPRARRIATPSLKSSKVNRSAELAKLMPGQKEVENMRTLSKLKMGPAELPTGRVNNHEDIFKMHEPDEERQERLFQERVRSTILNIFNRGTGFGPLMPQGHFTWLIVARRMSGKSTLLNSLMKKHWVSMRVDENGNLIKSKDQFFKKKILCSPTAGRDKSLDASEFDLVYTTREEMEAVIQAIRDGPSNGSNNLLVLDDVQSWVDHSANSLVSWFATVNRHYGWSMAISVQNLRQGLSPSIRNNLSEFTTFKIPLAQERLKIQQDIGTNFMQAYDMVDWTKKYQYMHMKITKGPTTWYFQGVNDEDTSWGSLLMEDVNLQWKLLVRE